jgi:hypothetical protein
MQASPDLIARSQLRIFEGASDQIALSDEARRRVLLLSQEEWEAWSRLKSGGVLPSRPALPTMLRRLGTAAYRIEKMAERRAAGRK